MKPHSSIGRQVARLDRTQTYLTRLNIVLCSILGGMLFALIIENWWY